MTENVSPELPRIPNPRPEFPDDCECGHGKHRHDGTTRACMDKTCTCVDYLAAGVHATAMAGSDSPAVLA